MPFDLPAWVWMLILISFLVGQVVSLYGVMRFFQRRQKRKRDSPMYDTSDAKSENGESDQESNP